MSYFIRIISMALLNGVLSFLLWNLIYYHKTHCLIKPSAGWVHVYDMIIIAVVVGLILGVMSVL